MTSAHTLLKARYAENETLPETAWNETLKTLLSHRSIRAYTSQALPDHTLETLIAAAQSAATSSNLQLWSVVAVEDSERRKRLSVLAGNQTHIRQAPLFLVWLADLARLRHVATAKGITAGGLDYLEMFTMAVVDASLAAQNTVIAAEALGLGTVYIGALRNQPERVAAEIGLPEGVFAVFGLCVGYPDPAATSAIKPRLPQAVVLHRERYQLESQDQGIERYDATMSDFYSRQYMTASGNWSIHSAKRISSPERLSGRDRLKEALNALGFKLL
jgi:nitroreductase